ncbi:hypothetical protein ABPG74_002300 [Tetrahymena malaccensis]
MDFDRSSISPLTQRSSDSPAHINIPQLRGRNQSLSSLKSFNLGKNSSPKSIEQENLYVLSETKKLLQRGKYKKAFINLRRYLMDQELSKSIQIDFYQQIIHICHKIIKKYFKKSTPKILNKVPPLMSIIYQYLNQWESFLVNLQSEEDCKDLVFTKQASVQEQVLMKKQSLIQKEIQEAKTTAYKQSQFQINHARNKQSVTQKNFTDMMEQNYFGEGQQNKKSQKNQTNQNEFEEPALKISDQLEQNQNSDEEDDDEENYDPLIIVKDKFHLHREQMLTYYLKSLYLSYQFHKQVNQPMRSLKFLLKGSDIVRNFLSNLLFVSSADLSYIAATIELTRGNIHLEQNQIEEADIAYEYAFQMQRNAIEIWFKKLGSFSKQDIPIKFEIKCEKSITNFVLILLVKSSCYEIQNQYSKALETIQLANWFSNKLLLYDSSSQLKQKITNHYNFLKEKYGDLLQEEAEIQKILRQFDDSKTNIIEQKQKEDTNRKQKLIDDMNSYLYNKAECEQLNKNLKILVKKQNHWVNKDEYNISLQLISSQDNIHLIDDQATRNGFESHQPKSLSQIFNSNNNSNLALQYQGQRKESAKNYLSISNLKAQNNKSLSEIPSFQDQTTQITGLAASKLYGIQNNQINGQNQNKNKSFREGFNLNNIMDCTYIEPPGQNSQLNSKRQSFSTHGIDLHSIINFDQNSNNYNNTISNNTHLQQKYSSEDQKLNSSFNNQGNFISPIAFNQYKQIQSSNNQLNPSSKNFNSGNNSNNSSFIGFNNQFNTNITPNLYLTDAFQNNLTNKSQAASPRVNDLSQLTSDQQNLSNNLNFQNKIQHQRNSFSQDLLKFNNDTNFEQRIRPFSAVRKIEDPQTRKTSLSLKQQSYSKKQNLSLNQNDLDKIQQNDNQQLFQKQGHKNYLNVDTGNQQYLGNQINKHQIQSLTPSSNNLSKSNIKLDTQKRQTRMTQSQSKIASFNNVNVLQKSNQHKQKEESKKHKVITSELYFSKEPPKFNEEPEKIEQLKQKYKFMRDDEDDVKEQQQKQEIKYKFMKIPLDQRRDLIDLDICMKKVIQEQLVSQTDHANYPYMHWLCGKTLQQVNMDKKELQFSNIMVQFKQKNGNGKSIPQIQQKEDTIIAIQREIKQFNEQATISRIKEKVKLNQSGNQIHDSQAFEKILNLNKSKPESQLQLKPIKPDQHLDDETKQDFNTNLKSKLLKAAQMQKQIDDGLAQSSLEGKYTDKKRAVSLLSSIQEQKQNQQIKKRSNNSDHKKIKQDQNTNLELSETTEQQKQLEYQQQIEKADYALKQIVLSNEQERESINKQIENLQNKHTKIGVKDLVQTLTKKEEEAYMSHKYSQNENNETGITHSDDDLDDKSISNNSRHQKMKYQLKTQKQHLHKDKILTSSKSFNHINPNYFNLSYLKKEFGDQLYSSDQKQSNIAFEVDKFLNLASSTKNLSQQKMFKQNQFSFAEAALLAKLKNLDNNGGSSSKHGNKNGKGTGSMPRRYTLLSQQKNN